MPGKEDQRLQNLKKRIAKAPSQSGIYRWLNEAGTILYVGKAKNLKKRLASYVTPVKKSDGPWKQSFKEQIVDFDMTVTTTELEALLLETNLIKQLRPKYNVLMKDDKNYLFIRISDDAYPTVETVRKFDQDGAKYFGPYLSGEHVRNTLDMLHCAFDFRACRQSIDSMNRGKQPERPCLEYQIGRCNGLCAEKISQEEYRRRIDAVVGFLKGNDASARDALQARMKTAAAERKFEQAAKLRNCLLLLEGKAEKQLATDTTGEDSDVIGVAVLAGRAHVVILHRRNGRLIGESHYSLAGQAESVPAVLEQFLPQYYDEGREIPDAMIIPDAPPEGSKVMEKLLRDRAKRAIKLIVPERGRKSRLLQLAERNAREKAQQMELKWEAEEKNTTSALEELQTTLSLPALPKRIEGYDISHLGGTETVGSMVVMKDGKAVSDQYRNFTIRTLKQGVVDDYKAIREVLTRRLRRLIEDLPVEEKKWNENGITFGKALKKEQSIIQNVHKDIPADISSKNIDYRQYIIARHDGDVIGFGRLFEHPQGILELKSVWVDEAFRGNQLGQFISRKLLRSVKKGKVYVTIVPNLEEYYARLGFRYIHNPPKVLVEEMEQEKREQPDTPMGIAMMWEAHQNKVDASLTVKPDLIVIDGGKGQLNTAIEVLKTFQMEIPVIGLAKREEEVFVPGASDPIPFRNESLAKFLLMRLRDEAHRFSNAHRERRGTFAMKQSALDDIPGIGEETKKKLLQKFGSISGIMAASDDALLELLSGSQLENLRALK